MDQRLVGPERVILGAVRAEGLSVIGGDDHDAATEAPLGLDRLDHATNPAVDRGEPRDIRAWETAHRWRRSGGHHLDWRVGIVIVEPEVHGPTRRGEGCNPAIGDRRRVEPCGVRRHLNVGKSAHERVRTVVGTEPVREDQRALDPEFGEASRDGGIVRSVRALHETERYEGGRADGIGAGHRDLPRDGQHGYAVACDSRGVERVGAHAVDRDEYEQVDLVGVESRLARRRR